MSKFIHVLATAFAVVVLGSNLYACSTLKDNQAGLKLFTQYGVMKYFERWPDPAVRSKHADTAREVLGALKATATGETVSIGSLRERALTEIARHVELTDADRLLASALVDALVTELATRVGEGVLSADKLVAVVAVIDWALEAVNIISPPQT